jgi:hypothetical protein
LTARLARLGGRHAGERCVIVANGPSLNHMDLVFLRRESTIGLNKIFLGLDRFGFYPRYYVAVNEKVIAQAAPRIRDLNCVKLISRRSAALVPEDGLTYHVDTANPPARFCEDISLGLHEGWTVTYAALQFAFHLGFTEVVLIGLDHRYAFQGAPNEALTMCGPDRNHFSPEYFGDGQRWDGPDLQRSEESYALARQHYERAGRRIYDATVDGACNAFEKVNYATYFGLRAAA